jgi:MFS-type transporter involved in bile tolerance (Atg22 family)
LITQYTGNNTYSMYLVMALYVLAGVILLFTVKAAKGVSRGAAVTPVPSS